MKDSVDDDAQLAQMGHKQELKRQFSLLYDFSASASTRAP